MTETAGVTFSQALSNFQGAGDRLALAGVACVSGATAVASGSSLVVKDGSASYDFTLQGAKASSYKVTADSSGGIEVFAEGSAGARALVEAAAGFGATPAGGFGASLAPHALPAGILAEPVTWRTRAI